MAVKIVECVPNFSEGTNQKIIDIIADSGRGIEGAKVLGIEPDSDYNRTVLTIAGEPESVLEAAFRVIKSASENIDMRQHSGEHPRIGAVDVCPFVPLKGVTMQDCVVLSTAHPCKFPNATNNAIDKYEKLPRELQYVLDKEENFQVLKNNAEDVKNFVKSKV